MATYTASNDLNKNKDYPKLWAELGRMKGNGPKASIGWLPADWMRRSYIPTLEPSSMTRFAFQS